jgi:hypothetical protein
MYRARSWKAKKARFSASAKLAVGSAGRAAGLPTSRGREAPLEEVIKSKFLWDNGLRLFVWRLARQLP